METTRKAARTAGDQYYKTTKPCKHGHRSKRWVSTGICMECSRLNSLERTRANPVANQTRVKTWQNANKAKHAHKTTTHYRAKKHGVGVEQIESMLVEQNHRCATCLNIFVKTPHLDHCHATGKIRGLLCGPCNMALGLVKDKSETLARMITYLA